MTEEKYRFGMVTLVGRPNVGKSSILNQLVGRKVSITSRRPQTTRHRVLGVWSTDTAQVVFVDTPGIHNPAGRAINRVLNQTAQASIGGVDLVLMVADARGWQDEDERALNAINGESPLPVWLVLNKIDLLRKTEMVLPLIDKVNRNYDFEEIIPISARSGWNLDQLSRLLHSAMPEGLPGFPLDEQGVSDPKFIAAEFIREQIFRQVGDEIPYSTAVDVLSWTEDPNGLVSISAEIWCENNGQKTILIGKSGNRLKSIGSRARYEIERYLGKKVHLEQWIKIRRGWSNDLQILHNMGNSIVE